MHRYSSCLSHRPSIPQLRPSAADLWFRITDSLQDLAMAESFIEDPETDEAKRPSPLTSLMVNLRTETLLSGGSLMRENDGCSARLTGHQIYIILPLTMIRFLSSGVKNGELHDLKTKVFKAMNELTPGVNCDLVLQHLSEVDTDYLVECVLEIARICRQLEEENENYRQRKEVFANLYEKERGQVVKYKIELEQQKKSAGKLEENLKWEVDQKIQQALEIGKLHAECTSLRTVLQHSTEEWNREKQNLLQIKNERLQQAEMQERNEKTITGMETSRLLPSNLVHQTDILLFVKEH